jgi:RNA polymerase sigma factor (sigma-70 family)
MNAEEIISQYEYLIPITLKRMYGNASSFAKSKDLEYEDLVQYARYGIYDAVNTFPEKQIGRLRNYIIRNIKWSVRRWVLKEQRTSSLYKFNHKKELDRQIPLISLNFKPFDDSEMTLYDVIPTDNINSFEVVLTENNYLSNETYTNLLSVLTDKEKEIVLLKMGGLSYTEIGEKYGVRKQAIGNRFKKIQEKINNYMEVSV